MPSSSSPAAEASSAASAGGRCASRQTGRGSDDTSGARGDALFGSSRAGTISPLHAQLSAPSSSSSLVLADVWLDAHSRASSMALA